MTTTNRSIATTMTASFWEAPMQQLPGLTQKLLNLGAGAVLWDITHKPPGTIEWE